MSEKKPTDLLTELHNQSVSPGNLVKPKLFKILRILNLINSQSFTRCHFCKMAPSPVKKAKTEDDTSSLANLFAEKRKSAGENVEKFGKFNMKR